MVEIYDAHEQGERVKKWLSENGSAIVMGLVLAFGGLFGFNQYKLWQTNSKQQAYAEFEVMNELLTAGQLDAAISNYQVLQDDYAKSPYASLAALQIARARIEASQPDLAIQQYRFVVENGRPTALKAIARDRMARVMLDQGQAEEALKVLDEAKDVGGFAARMAETRGDIYRQLGRSEDAIAAYQQALDELESGAGDRAALVLKLEGLGVIIDDEVAAS